MHLTQVLQPQLCLSLAQVAQFLGIPEHLICRIEHWPHQLFVHRQDRGGQFVSYRKFAAWVEACALSIRGCVDLGVLDWLGQVIREECQRFHYSETVVDYWRQLWRQQHYQLRLVLQPKARSYTNSLNESYQSKPHRLRHLPLARGGWEGSMCSD